MSHLYDGLVAAWADVAVIMDGSQLPEFHSHLLRQKCFVDHLFDEEQFSGLRGHLDHGENFIIDHAQCTCWTWLGPQKDSDQARITGFVASLESIEDERFAIMVKAVHVGMLREALQVRDPTDSVCKTVSNV